MCDSLIVTLTCQRHQPHHHCVCSYHQGIKATRNYIPMPSTGDVPYTHADITKARAELHYEPTTSLDEGLKIFVDWYKSYYKNGANKADQEYVPNR